MRSVAVFGGGACGALARWAVARAMPTPAGGFPMATLVVNVSGAFALSLLGVLITERLPPRRFLRPLVLIGFLGAYTTFSTMAVEGVRLLDGHHVGTALVYWIVTLLGGQLAGVYGMWLGRIDVRAREEAR